MFVPGTQFTLAWTHSIEKVRWEEDYAVLPAPAPGAASVLQATAARVQGSAAGMEPPPGARLRGGWYHYRPAQTTHTELTLTRSEFTADYELCPQGACQPLGHWLTSDGHTTRLWACAAP